MPDGPILDFSFPPFHSDFFLTAFVLLHVTIVLFFQEGVGEGEKQNKTSRHHKAAHVGSLSCHLWLPHPLIWAGRTFSNHNVYFPRPFSPNVAGRVFQSLHKRRFALLAASWCFLYHRIVLKMLVSHLLGTVFSFSSKTNSLPFAYFRISSNGFRRRNIAGLVIQSFCLEKFLPQLL